MPVDIPVLFIREWAQCVHELVKLLVASLVFSPVKRLRDFFNYDLLRGIRKNRVQENADSNKVPVLVVSLASLRHERQTRKDGEKWRVWRHKQFHCIEDNQQDKRYKVG